MKTILILTDADYVGGAETNYRHLLPLLQQNGWSPVFVSSGGSEMESYFQQLGMTIAIIPAFHKYFSFSVNNRVSLPNIFRTWFALMKNRIILGKLIRQYNPAAIISNSMVSHWLLSMVSTAAGQKKIMHLHDIVDTKKAYGLYGWGLNSIARKMDVIIAVSEPVKKQLAPGLQHKIRKIYNPAKENVFPKDSRSLESIRIGMFARYTEWKGHRHFIEIAQSFPTNTYQFISYGNYSGNEAYYDELKKAASQLPNADNIQLNGFCHNISKEMSKCDIILQLSLLPDASPKTMVEANLCQVPVYGYEGGGVKEMFEEFGLAGVLVSNGDKESLIREIKNFRNTRFVFPDLKTLEPATYYSRFEDLLT